MPGTLFVVATPIGNLEDITARALRVLRDVALIAAEDTRRTARLLARYAITTPTTSLHAHNERRKSSSIIGRLQRGESVALVSDAGTPTISDPGTPLVRAAISAGIRVETVPGPNAAIAALAISGLPSDAFTFLGFPPTRSKERTEWFDRLRAAAGTVIFYEAPHRVQATLQELHEMIGDCRVCVARELTKAHEELVIGPISEALRRIGEPRGEFVVVVDIGRSTDNFGFSGRDRIPRIAEDHELLDEFGHMTKSKAFTRRRAVSELARRHRRSANEIYRALERAKSSIE
jgi:16S rRNA (cytidine1402-2'-O)-methyltransferase